MSVLSPLSIAVGNSFHPLSNTPATSLTEYLPPGLQANALILQYGDPRKILFTLYSEQGNGFQRAYDFTCCDAEPAVTARAVLLLSFLLDDLNEDASKKLWNIVHDFYVTEEAMDLIRAQSEKLARHLHSLETWESSSYSKILRIINEETLTSLRDFFTKYASASPNCVQFKEAVNKIYRRRYKDVQGFVSILTRSFGVLASASLVIANHITQQFWESGVADIGDLPNATMVNPLFVYSSIAGDKFAVNPAIDPLSVYHISAFLPELTSEYTFAQPTQNFDENLKINIKNVINEAKKQFVLWSSAFQQFIKQSGNIVTRFVTADPVAYCFALQQQEPSICVQLPALSSTPWSGTRLTIPDTAPRQFNVIETSTLVDHVGIINILVATRPLLELSPASSISMETVAEPWTEENFFLHRTLCGYVPVLCAVLDIAPLGYLTGVQTRGLSQDLPIVADRSGDHPAPILSRMIWKIPASGDSAIALHRPEVSCDPREIQLFLFRLYATMFNVDVKLQEKRREKREHPSPENYSTCSFVALVAFLKRRIFIPWEGMMEAFMQSFGGVFPMTQKCFDDLEMQMHVMGVYSPSALGMGSSELCSDFDVSFGRSDRRDRINHDDPMGVICVIFTIPRRCLDAIYEKCFTNMRDVKCQFHFRLYYEDEEEYSVYSNLVPIFGKLIRGTESQSCRIETDKAGWHGSSDLHVCVYVSTAEVCAGPAQIISLNLTAEPGASAVFQSDYGRELQIYSAMLGDTNHVQLVKSIPGYTIPQPKLIPILCDETIELTENVTITRPTLKPILGDNPTISTKITFSADAKLSADTKVSYKQTSPCVITLTVGSVSHICHFPFPIDGKSAKLRIARTSGWIEVHVPLNPVMCGTGGYLQAPWPVTRDPKLVCNWNLPSVNFSSLPSINPALSIPWYIPHLENMYSDRERQRNSIILGDPLFYLKVYLLDIFKCINLMSTQTLRVRFGVREGDKIFVFFITGLFLDPSAHNVVAQAYVVETKKNTQVAALLDEIEYMTLSTNSEIAQYWKMAIPAMIERCRNWEHGVKCEHKEAEAEVTICSCGVGKVGPEFLQIKEWAHMAPYVTRCALSPLFSPPYVEPTRQCMLAALESLKERREMQSRTGSSMESRTTGNTCAGCGCRNGTKKCGRCGNVYYCGRNCQKNHWASHKRSCQQARNNSS